MRAQKYSIAAIAEYAQQIGFEIVRIRPMSVNSPATSSIL
jgi:hypothetical protein